MESLLQHIVNLTEDLLSFVDTNYCYQEVNEAYLKRYNRTRHDYIGKPVSLLMGEEQFLDIKPFLDRCFCGETITYEKWFDFGSHGRFYFSVSYTPYAPKNSVLGAIVSIRDRTKQKHLEEQSQYHQDMLLHYAKMAEFSSMASFFNHQWRTPLNSLGASFLKMHWLAKKSQEEQVWKEVIEYCESVLETISCDLEYFRDCYNPNKRFEKIDVEESLKTALFFLKDRCETSDVSIGFRSRKIRTHVLGHKSDLMHLLMIFLNNAFDAFESRQCKDPFLNICIKHQRRSIVLIIEDNAGGIDESVLKELFLHFVSTKTQKQGSGMGLFFARMIAKEKFGAELEIKNTGQGLQIILVFPK